MARFKRKRKIGDRLGDYASVAGGGYAGNFISNQIEANLPFAATNENISPAITALLGLALESSSDNEMLRMAGLGMFAVSSTELVQNAIDTVGGGGRGGRRGDTTTPTNAAPRKKAAYNQVI